MRFPYTKFPNGIKRPIICIAIEHKGKELPYYGLVDSGADMNLFHGELAELLGLDLEAGEKQFAGGIVEGEPSAAAPGVVWREMPRAARPQLVYAPENEPRAASTHQHPRCGRARMSAARLGVQ
jgi:hypothetical protein